jgi:hypothetical protein
MKFSSLSVDPECKNPVPETFIGKWSSPLSYWIRLVAHSYVKILAHVNCYFVEFGLNLAEEMKIFEANRTETSCIRDQIEINPNSAEQQADRVRLNLSLPYDLAVDY